MENLVYGDMHSQDKYVRKRFDYYGELLTPYIKEGVSILDIGCYTADLLEVLPKVVDYYGIDTDEEALEIARERGAKVFRADLETQNIAVFNRKFDIIITSELLEHLKDPEKLLLQINDLLKENGVLLVSLPNECTIYHRFKAIIGQSSCKLRYKKS